MAQFIAATTISSSSLMMTEAKGKKVRRNILTATKNVGFDPTTPAIVSRRNSDSQQQHSFDRPNENILEEVLTKELLEEAYEQQGSLQNNSNSSTSIDSDEHDQDLDIGVLPPASTPVGTPSLFIKNTSRNSVMTGCMIGYDSESLLPASEYIANQIDAELYPNGYGNIVFSENDNTIFCNQAYDLDEGGNHYGCASMHFKGCNVKCNGKESCDSATIEDAGFIDCHGESACEKANLDATNIDCNGDSACESAIIGDKQFVSMLDCRSGTASCAHAKVYSVGDVDCSGPRSCYGTALMGVTLRVNCFGLPDSNGYYYPTCGGEGALIEAADDHHIDVTCDGDFACIGYGHDAYDHKEHPSYFDIDVGKKGSLTCEDNFGMGNHDGDTYVCRYIDIIQGCHNYDCHSHQIDVNDNDDQQLPICNHIFSVHHHEMCTEGPLRDDDDDDDDDHDDNDDNSN